MANREPTADELNGVKQDTVHWPAKAYRGTLTDEDGNNINSENPLTTDSLGAKQLKVPWDYFVLERDSLDNITKITLKNGGKSAGVTVGTFDMAYQNELLLEGGDLS